MTLMYTYLFDNKFLVFVSFSIFICFKAVAREHTSRKHLEAFRGSDHL